MFRSVLITRIYFVFTRCFHTMQEIPMTLMAYCHRLYQCNPNRCNHLQNHLYELFSHNGIYKITYEIELQGIYWSIMITLYFSVFISNITLTWIQMSGYIWFLFHSSYVCIDFCDSKTSYYQRSHTRQTHNMQISETPGHIRLLDKIK